MLEYNLIVNLLVNMKGLQWKEQRYHAELTDKRNLVYLNMHLILISGQLSVVFIFKLFYDVHSDVDKGPCIFPHLLL